MQCDGCLDPLTWRRKRCTGDAVVSEGCLDLNATSPGRDAAVPRRRLYDRLPSPPPFDAIWSYRRRVATDLNVVRSARGAMVWRGKSGPQRLGQLGRYLGWFGQFPIDIVRFLFRYGRTTRYFFARSLGQQFVDMMRVALVNGLMPRDYYQGALARHRGGDALFSYIPFDLYAAVSVGLATRRDRGSLVLEADKSIFERRCREAGIPVVSTRLSVGPDGPRGPDGVPWEERLPTHDLILKPARGTQGQNVELWKPGDGFFVGPGSAKLTEAELIARAVERAGRSGINILIQDRETNHPDLAEVSGSALATCRIVTMINDRGAAEIVESYFRTSTRKNAAVDNVHAGGAWFPIDPATGRFQKGYDVDFSKRPTRIADHPQTRKPVAGRVHPGWGPSFRLALRAHDAFPDLFLVGWDVGYTPRGAVIVEFNVPPGITARSQDPTDGLVGTRFFKLLAWHANQWLIQTEPDNSRWRSRVRS